MQLQRRRRWLALVIFLATLALYAPACRNEYVNYDDNEYITENQVLKESLSWRSIAWAFTTTRTSNWHPLTWLSLELDAAIYGHDAGGVPRAWGVHFNNVLLHAVNAAMLSLLLSAILGGAWPGAIGAALFAWH